MSEPLDEALAYAAKDSIWLDRPVHQLRYLKVLAAEVQRLTAGHAHCERECIALKTDLEKAREQLTQVQKPLAEQDASAGEKAELVQREPPAGHAHEGV